VSDLPKRTTVEFAYCHPGWVMTDFMESLFGLAKPPNVDFQMQSLYTGPSLGLACNTLVSNFLEATTGSDERDEWLWMFDTDQSFAPDILERLLSVADRETCPILAGLVFTLSDGEIVPVMYQEVAGRWQLITEYPSDELIKVAAVGNGCLLIHRKVLSAMGSGWFDHVVDGKHFASYDMAFCVKARQLGFPVHVHTGIHVGHIKRRVIDEAAYIEQSRRRPESLYIGS
jgi:GT2 family glycosyltransferase